MLTEQQVKLIESSLTEDVEPRKVAAYLCLHIGLMLMEVTALKWKDVDLHAKTITLHGSVNTALEVVSFDLPRVLHIPPHVVRYLSKCAPLYESGECYILSGKRTLPPFHLMQNILTTVAMQQKLDEPLSATDLRQTFIRRCIQSGMDLYSLCAYIGIRQPNVIAKKYAQYFKFDQNSVDVLEQFAADYTAPAESEADCGSRRMNLLILGAGSQGPVIKEIAEAIGIFNEIAFLDDDPANELAIGPLSDIDRLLNRYPVALPSFGNGRLRQCYMDKCEAKGYIVVGLTHPSATVSPNATVGRSVVVEARSVVCAGAVIERGVLISSASVIGTGAHIGEFAHIGASATIEKNAVVEPFAWIESGTVVRALEKAI